MESSNMDAMFKEELITSWDSLVNNKCNIVDC